MLGVPEHNVWAFKALSTVWLAAVVDEGTQGVDTHANGSELVIADCVIVASKPCQKLGDVLHIWDAGVVHQDIR